MELIYILLLFLWGKVDFTLTDGGADLQDSEIFKQATASPESENVPEQPQPCPSDLQALVRDMRTKLSELQNHMETLSQLQVKVEQLRTENQEQQAKLAKNEVEIQELQTLNQDQAAELRSLKTWTNVTENHVDSLRRDRAVGRVAFSASLRTSGSGYSGPYDTHTTVVYRRVISNIGNAYNKATGIFTAPVGGAYHFEFHFRVLSGSGGTWASLMKNGERIVTAQEEQSNGFGNGGNAASLLLEAGDLVFVQLFRNYGMFDNLYQHSTFSGHLLFPM